MTTTRRFVILALLSTLMAVTACKRKGGGVSAPEELVPLTPEAALAFSGPLTAALQTCDKEALGTLIDVESMMRKAARQSKASGGEQRGLLAGMRESGTDIRTQFCGSADVQGGLHFLRVLPRDGKQTLLYRSTTDDSLNYIEFYAGTGADGAVKVDDIYIYTNGQTLVQTLAQMIDVLMGDTSVVSAFENISEQISTDPAKAMASLEAMPQKAQKTKPLQLLKIQAASGIDDATYESAISEYEKLFPGDPSLNLVSIDGFIVRKNYTAALETIDRLDKSVGGDDYLDELRVSLLLEEGKDLGRATAIAEKSLQTNPESEDAHYLLLGVHVANQNFGGAVAVMQMMGERFELVFEEEVLDPSDPNYVALKASPEWEAYKSKLDN